MGIHACNHMLSGQVLNRRPRPQWGRHCHHMTSHFPLFVLMKSCDPGAQGFNPETLGQAKVTRQHRNARAALKGNNTDSQIITKLSSLKVRVSPVNGPGSGPSHRGRSSWLRFPSFQLRLSVLFEVPKGWVSTTQHIIQQIGTTRASMSTRTFSIQSSCNPQTAALRSACTCTSF